MRADHIYWIVAWRSIGEVDDGNTYLTLVTEQADPSLDDLPGNLAASLRQTGSNPNLDGFSRTFNGFQGFSGGSEQNPPKPSKSPSRL